VGKFKVVGKQIRFGLEAVKNVGHGAIEAIVEARERTGKFESIFGFCTEVDMGAVNRRVIESLIQAGAFDSVSKQRSQLMASVDVAISYGQNLQEEKKRGQTSLFDIAGETKAASVPRVPEVPEWPISEILSKEKEMLGFYASGHPLTKYREELEVFVSRNTQTIEEAKDGEELYIGGVITNVKINIDRKKKQMAFITLEDFTGTVEVIVFSDCYEQNRRVIRADSMVLVKGQASTKEGEKPKVKAFDIMGLSKVYHKMRPPMHVRLLSSGTSQDIITELKGVLSDHPGKSPVILHVRTEDEELQMRLKNTEVEVSKDLLVKLKCLCGDKNVYVNRI
jgi:DNA polymerase-3 subunit alpha